MAAVQAQSHRSSSWSRHCTMARRPAVSSACRRLWWASAKRATALPAPADRLGSPHSSIMPSARTISAWPPVSPGEGMR